MSLQSMLCSSRMLPVHHPDVRWYIGLMEIIFFCCVVVVNELLGASRFAASASTLSLVWRCGNDNCGPHSTASLGAVGICIRGGNTIHMCMHVI